MIVFDDDVATTVKDERPVVPECSAESMRLLYGVVSEDEAVHAPSKYERKIESLENIVPDTYAFMICR